MPKSLEEHAKNWETSPTPTGDAVKYSLAEPINSDIGVGVFSSDGHVDLDSQTPSPTY